ncbi:hypothetical protein [Ramlibacter sp. 2FC]|uniref:hypothetical protein n=1 Tax=Ramlibacter sp. 2FC TaxID=2502188 RepID=UPI0010F6F43C|nr:hypothetical protein [Ramlibacter sp. 2FC]
MTTASLYRAETRRLPASGKESLPRLTRPLATLLLAAFVAALAVVADRWVDSWSDDHLLTAWLVIWAVVFAASLLAAGPARRLALGILTALSDGARARQQAHAEAMLRELVHGDERLLADISLVPDCADRRAQAEPGYDADAARGANIDEEISASRLRLRRARALM